MIIKPDLSQKYINPDSPEYPENLWCKSGHYASKTLEIDGEIKPMRFVLVSGPKLPEQYHGLYCEGCLILANKMARKR